MGNDVSASMGDGTTTTTATPGGAATTTTTTTDDKDDTTVNDNILKKCGSGFMGRLLVHRSGKVSFKTDDGLHFQVLPSTPCYFAQEVVSINHKNGNFCVLGNVSKRMSFLPDFSSLQ